jgi:tRNA pseudouridine38-40 synthase
VRLALGISYHGQAYQGWQSQASGLTVQDRLEAALGQFTLQRVSTVCAGRTDAGVPDSFHSRASAIARRYSYVVLESVVRPSLDSGRVGWVFRPLDAGAMREAAQFLLGEHDFTSFRASACQARSPVKTLTRLEISRRGAYWRFDFEASAFLHHMIRNLMGCLLVIGQGHQPPAWINEVLLARDRDAAAPTFSPAGLYFLGPVYEDHWGLPDRTPAYDWLP